MKDRRFNFPDRNEQVRELIRQDEVEEALRMLEGFPEFISLDARDDLILLQSRLSALNIDGRRQTLAADQYDAQRQQIKEGVLELVKALPARNPVDSTRSLERDEIKARSRYLSDLRDHIDNLISVSIHNAVFLDLGITDSPSATHLPWVYRNAAATEEFASVEEAFDGYKGRLLLLGSPGGGKTTTLQHIARRLIREAENDPSAPIPLMVNLSEFRSSDREAPLFFSRTFRGSRQAQNRSFEHWLVSKLESRKVKRSIAERWVAEGRIAALLDGLDEVNDDRRATLVRLLNLTYFDQYPESVVVVCSRIAEYEPLRAEKETRLQLKGAVTLQPLSNDDIEVYLRNAKAYGLIEALKNDEALSELARTPLTLSMMTLAYGQFSAAEISFISPSSSSADRRHHLMEYFVARMIQRKERKDRGIPFDSNRDDEVKVEDYAYDPARINRYLSWLAIQLSIRMQTTCSLDRLFSFFDRSTEGGEWSLSRWAVRIAKTGFVLLLMLIIVLPLLLASTHGASAAVLVCLAILSLFLTGSCVEAYQSSWMENTLEIGAVTMAVFALAAVSQAFHALVVPGLTPYLFGNVALSVTIIGAVTITARDEIKAVTRRVCGATSAALAVLISALIWAVEPARPYAGEVICAVAVLITLITLVAAAFEADDEQKAGRNVAIISSVLLACHAAVTFAIWLIGPLHAVEGIGLICAVFISISLGTTKAIPHLLMTTSFASIGAYVGGVNGAVLGGTAFGALWVTHETAKQNDLRFPSESWRSWFEAAGDRLRASCEAKLLSPVCLLIGIAGLRLPIRTKSFFTYCSQALILKLTANEVEFVHRRLRDYFALRELIPKLQAWTSVSRLDVIKTLGFQGASAIDPLSEIFAGGSSAERAAAISALGRIASPEVGLHLEKALDDPSPDVRAASVRGFRNLVGEHRVKLLSQAAADPSPQVQIAVFEAAISTEMTEHAETLVQKLVSRLSASPHMLRDFIPKLPPKLCRAIGQKLPAETKPLITTWLSEPQASLRANTCHLMSTNPLIAVPEQIRALVVEDRDASVRAAAAEALGTLGHADAGAALRQALRDANEAVRKMAARSLRFIGDPGAVEALIDSLEDRSNNVRVEAISSLGQIGERSAGDALVQCLKQRNRRVRIATAEALRSLRFEPAVLPLCDRLRAWRASERRAVAEALGEIGDVRATQSLLLLLRDRAPEVREASVKAVGEIGDPNAFQPLVQAYGRADSDLKPHIIDAVGGTKHISAATWLNGLCEFREQALTALIRSGPPGGMEIVLNLIEHGNSDDRHMTVTTILRHSRKEFLERFIGLLESNPAIARDVVPELHSLFSSWRAWGRATYPQLAERLAAIVAPYRTPLEPIWEAPPEPNVERW